MLFIISVFEIGGGEFSSTASLSSLTLTNGLLIISNSMFNSIPSILTTVTVPSTVTSIGLIRNLKNIIHNYYNIVNKDNNKIEIVYFIFYNR